MDLGWLSGSLINKVVFRCWGSNMTTNLNTYLRIFGFKICANEGDISRQGVHPRVKDGSLAFPFLEKKKYSIKKLDM